jgi:hypothetical protein
MQIPIPQKINEGAFEGAFEGVIEGDWYWRYLRGGGYKKLFFGKKIGNGADKFWRSVKTGIPAFMKFVSYQLVR